MDKSKFEEAKCLLERIEHFKELRKKIDDTKDNIVKNKNIPSIKKELVERLATLILNVYDSRGIEFVFDDFVSMVKKECFDAITELEEEFRQL